MYLFALPTMPWAYQMILFTVAFLLTSEWPQFPQDKIRPSQVLVGREHGELAFLSTCSLFEIPLERPVAPLTSQAAPGPFTRRPQVRQVRD